MMFSLPDTVSINGTEYEIRTDFRVILEIFVMLDDPDLTDADKTEALIRMFYMERPPDTEAAIKAFTEFVNPRGSSKSKKPSSQHIISWQQDFDLMVAPINHILGTECRCVEQLHWHTFLATYLEIPPDSVFARVLRIREKLRHEKKLGFRDLCNAALNECLGRTVITSVTTFFAVLALFAFGDGSIFDFALIMLFGVVAGTFSSMFIATPVMFWWYKGKRPDFEGEAKQQG